MIPVLYKANATDFTTYGIGVLKDCTSCEVTEERNGAFECVLKYPITGAMYKEIALERLVKAKPNDTANDQVFRIYRVTTPINGQVTVYAQHISYDLSNVAALQWEAESISPQLAMERVFQNTATPHNFTCQTEYSAAKAFSVKKPQSVRACLGGVAGSFLDLWGGEYEWDNFKVIHHQGRGQHTGVVIEYGKNLTELEHDSENTDVYTDLLPYAIVTAEDGTETAVTLSEVLLPIADSTLVQRKTLIRDFTEYFDEEETVTEDALRAYANKYLKSNPMGTPTPTLTVAFEPLWKQPEYVAVLERVSLCDTVTIRHSLLGITSKAKVITTKYDTLAEKYISIELGSSKANLLNNVSAAESAAEDASAKVDRFPVLMNSAIKNATGLITGQTGGYVVIHTDSTSGKPYELLILDAPSIEEAVNVWRWNVGGLGFSSNGYNGPYETAITADGQIVADFITSGTLVLEIVLEQAKEKTPSMINSIRLKIIHDQSPNAFAIGHRTICVTDGLLNLSDNEIMAVFAHEVGHLAYKHSAIQLLIGGGNLFISGCLLIIKAICWMITAICGLVTGIATRSFFAGVFATLAASISSALIWLWTKFCMLFLMWSMRQNEFVADEYAYSLGYGVILASVLDRHMCSAPDNGLLKALYSTHPHSDDRVARLQDLGANYSRY